MMTKREINEAGKLFVLQHGPARVMEFGEEIFRDNTPRDIPEWEYRQEIMAAAMHQAERVYAFLGYDCPWS